MGRSVSVPSGAAIVTYVGFEANDGDSFDDFQYMINETREALTKAMPSVTNEDRWLHAEDHAIAANHHAYFGVSEYCGLVSCWVVPRDSEHEGLRDKWIDSIEKKFLQVVENVWGQRYTMWGRASNGEAFFNKAGD